MQEDKRQGHGSNDDDRRDSLMQSNLPRAKLCHQPLSSKELCCFEGEYQLIGHRAPVTNFISKIAPKRA